MENLMLVLEGNLLSNFGAAIERLSDSIAEPSNEDLMSAEHTAFVDLVLRDALGERYHEVV